MARFTRLEVYQAMFESGLVPLFYHPDVAISKQGRESLIAIARRVHGRRPESRMGVRRKDAHDIGASFPMTIGILARRIKSVTMVRVFDGPHAATHVLETSHQVRHERRLAVVLASHNVKSFHGKGG